MHNIQFCTQTAASDTVDGQ